MLCKRCPHLVRHGQLAKDNKSIEFKSLCGLVMKQNLLEENGGIDPNKKMAKKPVKKESKAPQKDQVCKHYPFPEVFDYIECQVYQGTFKSSTRTNDVIPTKDFQYSDALSGNSITDMELL
ncbi:MAG: hypothetical protein HRU19_06420 [Pseudobacteriovorax sp.]|nr:hypothetical protein [Pseudobacteriovorax sp.]